MSQKEIIKESYTLNEKEYIQEIGNNRIYDVELKPTIIFCITKIRVCCILFATDPVLLFQ